MDKKFYIAANWKMNGSLSFILEYFDSIKSEYFSKTELTTVCGWKGKANYYSVTVDGKTNKDCAWYYAEPNDAAKKIKGMVAFWNGVQVQ